MRLSLLIWAVFVVSLVASQKDCSKIIGPNGERYDLSPIVGLELLTNDGFSDYKVSICTNSYQCGGCTSAGFCQTNEFFQDCMGVFAGASVLPDGTGVLLLYDKGDYGTSAQVQLTCNPSANGVTNVVGENFYKLTTGESKYACPGAAGGISVGTAIMIILIVVIVLYLVVGILWNKFREEKEGIELIPNLEFWTGLPSLVKDGAVFGWGTVSTRIRGGDSL